MRLNDVKQILKNTKQDVVEIKMKTTANPNVLEINNIQRFMNFLKLIENIKACEVYIGYFKKSVLSGLLEDEISVSKHIAQQLIREKDALFEVLNIIFIVTYQFAPNITENSITIKLPDNDRDFNHVVNTISKLEKHMSQIIVNNDIKGHAKVDSFEHGSLLLTLCVGSITAVVVIAMVTWSAAVVSKKKQESKLLEEVVRGKKLKNNFIDDLVDVNKKELDMLVEIESQHIYEKNYNQDGGKVDNEQIERIKGAVRVFSELIDKGTEIYPALMEPEKASNLFPDFKSLDAITSKVAQLEDKSEE